MAFYLSTVNTQSTEGIVWVLVNQSYCLIDQRTVCTLNKVMKSVNRPLAYCHIHYVTVTLFAPYNHYHKDLLYGYTIDRIVPHAVRILIMVIDVADSSVTGITGILLKEIF